MIKDCYGNEYSDEDIKKLVTAIIAEDGGEIFNPIPAVEIVEGLRPLTLQEQVKRILQIEINRKAKGMGVETLEESMDLDVDEDEGEPLSGYEYEEMTDENPYNNNVLPESEANDETGSVVPNSSDGVPNGSEGDNPESSTG